MNRCIVGGNILILGNAVIPQQARKAFHTLCGSNHMNTISDLNECWTRSSVTWNSNLPIKNIPKCGSFDAGILRENTDIALPSINIFPPTIQRFKKTHSLPTPTASDHIIRKPTNTKKNRAFRPGVNKSVSLNRWIEMFPDSQTPIPELDEEGYLIDDNIKGLVPKS